MNKLIHQLKTNNKNQRKIVIQKNISSIETMD